MRPAATRRPLSDPRGTIGYVRVAAVPGPGRSGLLCELNEDGGRGQGQFPVMANDLAVAVSDRERAEGVRWVWADTARVYPVLARAGVRVRRCHDVALTE